MFFWIGKLVTLFLHPLVWVFVLILIVLLRKKALGKKAWLVMGLVLFMASNKGVVNLMLLTLETSHVPSTFPKTAVVLGGYCNEDPDRGGIRFYPAAERLFKAIELEHKGKIDTIILSGGNFLQNARSRPEALVARDYLLNLGIDSQNILTETKSISTWENAKFTKEILQEQGITQVCLITSAFHMSRSLAVFNKQGISVKPYPVNFYSSPWHSFMWYDWVTPSTQALLNFDMVVKEWVGYLAYKFTGRL
jgi:uncharacterized SAM-binding protein YcdF (DUF218 family)